MPRKDKCICNRDCFNCQYDDCYDNRTYLSDFEKQCQGFEKDSGAIEYTIKEIQLNQRGRRVTCDANYRKG